MNWVCDGSALVPQYDSLRVNVAPDFGVYESSLKGPVPMNVLCHLAGSYPFGRMITL